MTGDGDYRRFQDGTKTGRPKRPVRAIVVPAIVLVLWTSVVIAALLRTWNAGGDPLAILIILAIGGMGIAGVGKSLIKRLRDLN